MQNNERMQANELVKFQYNDGGRQEAGYKGYAGDCVVRAIAIAAELPYKEVYNELFIMGNDYKDRFRNRVAKALAKNGASPRNGVFKVVYHAYLKSLGFEKVVKMGIGTGCTTHLRSDELPKGRLVVEVSRHVTAVVDGVLHDIYDCSRDGTRCVYAYWIKNS